MHFGDAPLFFCTGVHIKDFHQWKTAIDLKRVQLLLSPWPTICSLTSLDFQPQEHWLLNWNGWKSWLSLRSSWIKQLQGPQEQKDSHHIDTLCAGQDRYGRYASWKKLTNCSGNFREGVELGGPHPLLHHGYSIIIYSTMISPCCWWN